MIRVIVNYFLPVLILHSSNIAFADPCRFELSGKGVIDLSSVGFSNGSSAFPESDPGPFSSFSNSWIFPWCKFSRKRNSISLSLQLQSLLCLHRRWWLQKCCYLSRLTIFHLWYLIRRIFWNILLESRNKAYKFALGTQESAVWSAGDGTGDPVILYNYQTKNVSLTLHCLESGTPSLQAFGEGPVEFYKLQLNHKCACWNACSKIKYNVCR